MPGRFFDTNILLYLASADASKADRAERIVAEGGSIIVQVLNEIANVARRKMRLNWEDTRWFLATVRALLPVEPLTVATHEAGLRLAGRYGLSTYDAMIAASALMADCDVLWSEDMQHGLIIEDRLRIVDPFKAASPDRPA